MDDRLLQGAFRAVRQMLTEDQSLAEIAAEKGLIRPEDTQKPLAQVVNAEQLKELLAEYRRRMEGLPALERYELHERLGEGAVAVVYRARDRQLGRDVALKLLRPGLSEDIRKRFVQEARLAATLSHPNVVTVFDAGESEGRPYIVMELVAGRPPERLTLELLAKVADGVAAAHAKGIVHRDLKPANLLMSSTGEPKVADFGLAHLDDAGLTRAGATLGTPRYMSPEQVKGEAVTPATDVYALGVMLYEILTGQAPHAAETLRGLYEKILHEVPKLPGSIPPALRTIGLKALDKNPAGRYPTAAEFAQDLQRHLSGRPVLGKRRRRFPAAVFAAALGTAAVLALLIHTGGRPPVEEKSRMLQMKMQQWAQAGLRLSRLQQHAMIAGSLVQQGKASEAEAVLEEALRLDPAPERIELKVRNIQQGVEAWQRMGRDASPVARIMQEFEPRMREGRLAEAEALADQALNVLRQ